MKELPMWLVITLASVEISIFLYFLIDLIIRLVLIKKDKR